MGKVKALTRKQLRVVDDLLSGKMDEAAVLAEHGVSAGEFGRWLRDDRFTAELRWRMQGARLRSDLIIAQFAQIAAMKLVELTSSEKEETARKACLDVISMPLAAAGADKLTDADCKPEPFCELLTPEMADKLLSVLAGKEN